ncbi:MAG: N-acetyltransferase [Clostridiales bacterium]|nr:N-acetyltransferase [Clostridiales bacterium]
MNDNVSNLHAMDTGSTVNNAHVKIRHSRTTDLDAIMNILSYARQRMRLLGNYTQWTNGYPSAQVIIKDIEEGNSYLIESDKGIWGVFTFVVGEEPNYKEIDGEWPDDKPYGTIHRIASAEGAKGIADLALDFCQQAGVNIRIDTHTDNAPMLGWIGKRGFRYCGIIRVEDGTPRKAFQLTSPVKTTTGERWS